ncbi:MAG: hypothetical protein AAF735_04620 [Myxococcota bacterium]
MQNVRPKVRVDFNEFVEEDMVLLSKTDNLRTAEGEQLLLREGMELVVFMDDVDESGSPRQLSAFGRAERNRASDWSKHISWVVRIVSWVET